MSKIEQIINDSNKKKSTKFVFIICYKKTMSKQLFLINTGLFKILIILNSFFKKKIILGDYLNFISKNRKSGLINDYYNSCPDYKNRFLLHERLIKEFSLEHEPLSYIEFGVAKGDMIKYWSAVNINPQSEFIGFDSFEGLPEDWGILKKGHFDTHQLIPKISDPRVKFVKGWFQDTIFKELPSCNYKKRVIFHLDADLYSSTLFVLFQIHPYIKKGDIVIFDEFSKYEDEFLALETFKKCTGRDWNFNMLGAINNFSHVAFMID